MTDTKKFWITREGFDWQDKMWSDRPPLTKETNAAIQVLSHMGDVEPISRYELVRVMGPMGTEGLDYLVKNNYVTSYKIVSDTGKA